MAARLEDCVASDSLATVMDRNGSTVVRKTLYEDVADRVSVMIDQGVFRTGERIPSVRSLSRQFKVSVTTVLEAYKLLEDRGAIKARPQSGYYVNGHLPSISAAPDISQPALGPTRVTNSELSLALMQEAVRPGIIPLGCAIPNPELLPTERINHMLAAVARQHPESCVAYELVNGCSSLRVQIARRGLAAGCSLSPEGMVVTSGCLEAVYLALQATCRPGDVVAIESPTYFSFLLTLQKLDLRALEIPCHPREGVSLDALRYALEHNSINACLFNLNFNNPIGSLMPESRKKDLVELLAAHDVPLIEDDLYGDLPFGAERPKCCKAYDTRGLVLLCSSFSKTLAPGYRVGWIAPGRYQAEVEHLKFSTNICTPSPTQLAIGEFLANGGYDRYLRKVRRIYASQLAQMTEAVGRNFPEGTRTTRPAGGFVLWVECPPGLDSLWLHEKAMERGISIAPGPLFTPPGPLSTPTRKYVNCIRLNAAFWSPKVEQAIEVLGGLVVEGLRGGGTAGR